MIVQIVVTCVLSQGQVFVPPKEWSVWQVQAYDSSTLCDGSSCMLVNRPDSSSPTLVTLTRKANTGEKITAPEGCGQLEVTP